MEVNAATLVGLLMLALIASSKVKTASIGDDLVNPAPKDGDDEFWERQGFKIIVRVRLNGNLGMIKGVHTDHFRQDSVE